MRNSNIIIQNRSRVKTSDKFFPKTFPKKLRHFLTPALFGTPQAVFSFLIPVNPPKHLAIDCKMCYTVSNTFGYHF